MILLARSWKWLLLLLVVGAVVFRVRFAPGPATAHTIAATTVVGETMGTGTLEARLTATISPKVTGRLAAVLVDQGDRDWRMVCCGCTPRRTNFSSAPPDGLLQTRVAIGNQTA